MNTKMSDLRACFEQMGFTAVKTVLSSGNVVFAGAEAQDSTLANHIEAGMEKILSRRYAVIVRSTARLLAMIEVDPYAEFCIGPNAKRVVTFLREPHPEALSFPIEREGAKILAMTGTEVFAAYVPHEHQPVFMVLIEKTFGKQVTTRTWDTVKKCALA